MKKILIIITTLLIVTILSIYIWQLWHRQHVFEMYVFDMKNGSSIFIRTENDKRILINGGGSSEVVRELTKILPFYSRSLDLIISTDTNGKNVTGLIEVLNRYNVSKVIIPAIISQEIGVSSSSDQIYQTLVDTVEQKNIQVQKVLAGDSIQLDENVKMEVLFPLANTSFEYSKSSSPELTLRIENNSSSFLLLGNASTKIQKAIASSTKETDFLIISHSASADSLTEKLITVIKPKYLFYSKSITQNVKSSKNTKPDPLYFIIEDKRYNVKNGTIKVILENEKINIFQ